ncbi:MAG: hypothetical protein K0V04_09865 [Deltaproteobacteria bacterium]|nr:hypothetical protein [Deltaproteobacteria bacterium]
MMLGHHFDELSTPEQLHRFKQRYEAAIVSASKGKTTTSVPMEYLDKARVFGLHDASRQLVGGFVINFEAPLLVLGTVPPSARDAWLRVSPLRDQCELVAIWKAPHLPQAAAAFVLWPRIIRECATAGRKYILGLGYQNRMNAVYRVARPTQLYSGLRTDKPELRQHVTIYAYTPLSITLTYVTNLCTELVLKPPRRMLGRLRRRITH